MAEFIDKMNVSDKPLEMSLRCAKCGAYVRTGKEHLCGYKPNHSASTEAEMYFPIRSKDND